MLNTEKVESGVTKHISLFQGSFQYTYAQGASGASGTTGLQTTTQGARLVYVDDTARKDMSMTLTLSPHKTGAQGFGKC